MSNEPWHLQMRDLLATKGIRALRYRDMDLLYAHKTAEIDNLQLLVSLISEARNSGLPLSINIYDQSVPKKEISEFVKPKPHAVFNKSNAYQVWLDDKKIYDLETD